MPEDPNKPGDGAEGGAAAGAAGAGAGTPSGAAPKPITFQSQEELDRIIADRVARAKPKDYDELVALRDKVKAEEDAKKDDLQKEKDARAEAERKAAERSAKADAKLKRAALLAEATKQNAVDADIIVALLAGSDSITVDEDGEVAGVEAAVKKLLKDKPVLVKGAPGARSGGEFGGNDSATLDERIAELERAGKWAEARTLKLQKGLGA